MGREKERERKRKRKRAIRYDTDTLLYSTLKILYQQRDGEHGWSERGHIGLLLWWDSARAGKLWGM